MLEQFQFPGDFEEFLESVLRVLSVPKTSVSTGRKLNCFATSTNSRFGMSDFDDGAGDDDKTEPFESRIETALLTLASVEYILKRGRTEFSFRPIQKMHQREMDGEIYYLLSFTHFFFGNANNLFERLFGEQND